MNKEKSNGFAEARTPETNQQRLSSESAALHELERSLSINGAVVLNERAPTFRVDDAPTHRHAPTELLLENGFGDQAGDTFDEEERARCARSAPHLTKIKHELLSPIMNI